MPVRVLFAEPPAKKGLNFTKCTIDHDVFQALVHLLRSEGVQLGDSPIPPEDTVKLRPKRYEEQQVNVEELPEWAAYRCGILRHLKSFEYLLSISRMFVILHFVCLLFFIACLFK